MKHDQQRVPQDEVDTGITVEDMSEPVGFLSGVFCGSKLRYTILDKREIAIVSTF